MHGNSIWFWKMTGHTRKMEWLEGKREGNWSDKRVNERDMKGRWEGKWDERKGKPEEHQKDMKEQKERREIK